MSGLSGLSRALEYFSPGRIPVIKLSVVPHDSGIDILGAYRVDLLDGVYDLFKALAKEGIFKVDVVPKIFVDGVLSQLDEVTSKISEMSDLVVETASAAEKKMGELRGALSSSQGQVASLSGKVVELEGTISDLQEGAVLVAEKVIQLVKETCGLAVIGLTLMAAGHYGTTREESKKPGWQKNVSYGTMGLGFLLTAGSAARLYLAVQKL